MLSTHRVSMTDSIPCFLLRQKAGWNHAKSSSLKISCKLRIKFLFRLEKWVVYMILHAINHVQYHVRWVMAYYVDFIHLTLTRRNAFFFNPITFLHDYYTVSFQLKILSCHPSFLILSICVREFAHNISYQLPGTRYLYSVIDVKKYKADFENNVNQPGGQVILCIWKRDMSNPLLVLFHLEYKNEQNIKRRWTLLLNHEWTITLFSSPTISGKT